MKIDIRFVAIAAILVLGTAAGYVLIPASAQRATNTRFDYAVINGNYLAYPQEGVGSVGAAVNVCYLSAAGCQNEEVRADVVISKFLQDERLENNPRSQQFVRERANQQAYARAITKLGSDGWEMVNAPQIEFDLFYTNPQGIQTVKEANRTERQHVWFRRQR